MRVTNENFVSCNSYLHKLHESKLPFVTLSNLSVLNFRTFLLMYPGLMTPAPRAEYGAAAVRGPLMHTMQRQSPLYGT